MRLLLCLAAVFASVTSHAYLNLAWGKTLPANTRVHDIAVDSAGNTVIMGLDGSGDSSIYVSKVTPAGVTSWTKLIGAGAYGARSVALDNGGSIYVEYQHGNGITIHKMRSSDGASLGSLVLPDLVDIGFGRSGLVVDGANNVFFVARYYINFTQLGGLVVANLNASNIANSTYRRYSIANQMQILQCRPRPQGGVNVLAGLPVETPIHDGTWISSLYSFGPAGAPTMIPIGYGTTFATVPGTNNVLVAGSQPSTFGYILMQEITPAAEFVGARNDNVGEDTASFNDMFITKSGIAMIGGRLNEPGDVDYDSIVCSVDVNDELRKVNNHVFTAAGDQEIHRIDGDIYGTVIGAEFVNSSTFKFIEIDPTYAGSIATRTYTSAVIASRPCLAVNDAGFIAGGMGNRVTALKPRDLKDIYMGSTTYKGGTTATAIVRMYDVHTVNRTVTLSDGGSSYVTIATSKIIATGATQVSATVLTNAVPSTQNITLTAKYGNQTRTFAFTLTP